MLLTHEEQPDGTGLASVVSHLPNSVTGRSCRVHTASCHCQNECTGACAAHMRDPSELMHSMACDEECSAYARLYPHEPAVPAQYAAMLAVGLDEQVLQLRGALPCCHSRDQQQRQQLLDRHRA